MNERIKTFREFYEFYITQHMRPMTRLFHFMGVFFTLWVIIYILISGQERFLWYLPITLLGIAGLSHLIFEKNRPTLFRYPIWTLLADFRLFYELLSGQRRFRAGNKNIIK